MESSSIHYLYRLSIRVNEEKKSQYKIKWQTLIFAIMYSLYNKLYKEYINYIKSETLMGEKQQIKFSNPK